MTRFARAQGSKASNLREPEEATPWHVMKQELETKKYEKPEDNMEEISYKKYLEERSEESPTKWVDFSDEESGTQPSQVGVKKHKNKFKNKQKKLIKSITEHNTELEEDESVKSVSLKKSCINKNQTVNQNVQQGKKSEIEHAENNNEKDKKRSKKRKHQASIGEIQEIVQDGTENKLNKQKKQNKNKEMNTENNTSEGKILNTSKAETKNKNGLKKKQNKFKKSEEKNNKNANSKNFNQNRRSDKFENKRNFKDGKEKNRRKPKVEECIIGGRNVTLMYIDGFPVKKEDGERLIQLRKDLISKGVPRSEIEKAMKLERRRAEKALAREKKKLCFNCRGSGHVLSECPNISMDMTETTATGICFKCGSTEHTHFECKVVKNDSYKFAQCFICKEQGHISRQCPDNPKGLYPQGGGCNVCGDVTHLKKDCPVYVAQQEENKIAVDTIDDSNIESIGHNSNLKNTKNVKKQKIVKF